MLLFENVKLALTAIRSNKLRSFLTMLGIIIGISSVIAITSIGDSAKGAVGKEFETFGKNAIMIYMNWNMTEDYIETEDMISLDDIEALKAKFPERLAYIAPSAGASTETNVGTVKGKFYLTGVDGNYDVIKNMNIIHGRMISDADTRANRDVVVIDKEAAVHYFNRSDVVGKTLPMTLKGEQRDLTIIGVFQVEKTIFSAMGGGSEFGGYVPYSIVLDGEHSSMLEAFLSEDADLHGTNEQISRYLEKIKKKPTDYYLIESAEDQLGVMNQMLGTLSIAIGAIAAISLVVGGIGIMNIMLVSVTERTREIGIRKSLGARTKDVLQQFLIEAMILSVIGGIIGTLIGVGIASIGMKIAGIELMINPMIIVVAVIFSAVVGMFFGFYPAKKAAKLDPIEALRYE